MILHSVLGLWRDRYVPPVLIEDSCHVGGRQDGIPEDHCSCPGRVLEVLIPHGVALALVESSAVGMLKLGRPIILIWH